MGDETKIQWTDFTFNPHVGCTKVHTGCANCYAERDFDKRRHFAAWGDHGTRVLTTPANWRKPLKWNEDAAKEGVCRRVFCASLADVFEDWAGPIINSSGGKLFDVGDFNWRTDEEINRRAFPGFDPEDPEFQVTMTDVRERLFHLIDATPNLDWQLLTKRPENILRMWPLTPGTPSNLAVRDSNGKITGHHWYRTTQLMYRPNVWIGTSISDQATADKFVHELLKCRDLSPVLFLSAEPLVGPIDLSLDGLWCKECPRCIDRPVDSETNVVECRACDATGKSDETEIDWVIVGGESGNDSRPCRATWVRDIVETCDIAKVPVFVKQLGSNAEEGFGVNRKLRLVDKKGGNPDEWPEDLRVRQFPLTNAVS